MSRFDGVAVGLLSTQDYLPVSSLFLEADSHLAAAAAEPGGGGEIRISHLL